MNGLLSSLFASYFSFWSTGGTKYTMPAFSQVQHHAFSGLVPVSVWFVDMGSVPCLLATKSQKWPTSLRELWSVCCYIDRIRITIFNISSFSLINVIVHWHEDDPSLKLLWFTPKFRHHLWNLSENCHCSESCENCPLEFHRRPVDSTQIFETACLQIPFNWVFPSLDWCCTGTSQIQYWVGKDVGLGFHKKEQLYHIVAMFLST